VLRSLPPHRTTHRRPGWRVLSDDELAEELAAGPPGRVWLTSGAP
jgi:hypothetical protein